MAISLANSLYNSLLVSKISIYVRSMSLIPIIQIDSDEARKLDVSIDLQKIYYQPSGYQRTVKKLFEASQKAGHYFALDKVKD